MNKTIFAILALALMLVSMLPAVLAEDNDGVRPMATNSMTEECVDRLKAQYPDVDEERLEMKCRQLRSAAVDAEPIPAVTQLRAEYQERVMELNEEHRAKLAELNYEYMRKVTSVKAEMLENLAELSQEDLEKLAKLDRARIEAYAEKSPEEIHEALRKVTIARVQKEEAFRTRVVAAEKVRAAEQQYQDAVRNYNQAKRMFEERKRAWEDAVEDGNETAAIGHAKAYLGSAADMVIEALNEVRARVEANDDLTEEEVEDALADIDAKIAEMESLQEDLEAAETKDEVKEVGKDILAAWERTRHRLKVHAEHVVRTQVGEILSRSEALEQHLERILAEMEAEGVDVEDLDEKLDDFSELIASAREKLKDSRELFEQAKDRDDRSALDESKALLREAHEDLKEAHSILMEIVREVKEEGYDVEDDDEYVEVIEEDDDDDDYDEEDEEESEDDSSEDESEEETCDEPVIPTCDADEVLVNETDSDGCVEWECEDVEEEDEDEDSLVCCESFGYGAEMVKCCEEYEWLAEDDCVTPEGFVGGGKAVVDDDYCSSSEGETGSTED